MTARYVAEPQVANAGADEPFHFIADLVKHAANLTVQALLQDNAQPGRADRLQAREPGALALEKNAIEQLLRMFRLPTAIEGDFVFLLDLVARMSEMLGKITVARQEKQAFRLGVEPADVEKPGKLRRQQIVDRISRVRIMPGGNKPGGFVQNDGQRFGPPDEPVAHLDVIGVFDLGAEIGAGLAVHGDAAFRDQLVTMPARAEPGRGEKAIEAHGSSLKRLKSYSVKGVLDATVLTL